MNTVMSQEQQQQQQRSQPPQAKKANNSTYTNKAINANKANKATKRAKATKVNKAAAFTHPCLLDYIQSVFTGAPLRSPRLPYIRSLVPSPAPSFVVFHDRTFREWIQLCEDWEASPDLPGFTFLRETAARIRAAFYASQRARWLARCYLRAIRMRIARRRSDVGDDLVTCSPIPPVSCVTVYDFKTRSLYTFHAQTLVSMIVNSLLYSNYGVASPMCPKNPYTNVPWSVAQLTSIVGQCAVAIMTTRHRALPWLLNAFRSARYSVPQFHRENRVHLGIEAALRFFSQHSDPDTIAVGSDILEDLYTELAQGHPLLQSRRVIALVAGRALPPDLQSRWDQVLVSVWIYDNLNIIYGNRFRNYQDILDEVITLHMRTLARSPQSAVTFAFGPLLAANAAANAMSFGGGAAAALLLDLSPL
jgi:hypothetical protein